MTEAETVQPDTAMKRGFQTREAEMILGPMVGELEEVIRTGCKSQPI